MDGIDGVGGWIAGAGALLIGISKTGLPGVGIVAIPLFAAIIPAKASTGVVLPMLILGDVFAVAGYRRHAVWRHLLRVIPWTLAGIVAGSVLLGRLNDRQLRPLIGIIILGMLALGMWRERRPDPNNGRAAGTAFAALIGVLAGITTMMANAAGPIMTIYLLAMGLPKREFIGTGAWFFFLMNVFKVPFSAHLGLISAESIRLNAMLAPAVVAGALLGFGLARWIPQKPFNLAARILAAAGAAKLMIG